MQQETLGRRAGGAFLSLFPHLLMTYSWMLLTFYVINIFNPAMCFLSAKTSQHFEIVYAATALICAGTVLFRKSLYVQHPSPYAELDPQIRKSKPFRGIRKLHNAFARFSGRAVPFIRKTLRIAGVLSAAAAIALAVPVIHSLSAGSRDALETAYFRTAALISGIMTLIFSIMNIALQHYQVKAAFYAGKSYKL